MVKYIVKRIAIAILTLFVIATFTFWLSRAIPGGPFSREKPLAPTVIANLERKYGLDKPLIEQYLIYMKNVATFDFGLSYYAKSETVNQIIERTFPVSCLIGLWAFIIAIILGIPLGTVSALMENRAADSVIKIATTLFIAVPSFVMASFFMYFLGYQWKLLPVAMWGTWQQTIMPIMALSVRPLATITKYMRSSMLEVLDTDYIRTSKAKGANSFTVIYVHALKNALLPILTVSGRLIVNVICGSIVIEQIFAIPGLGKSFTQSVLGRDYSMIMGVTVFYAMLFICIFLIVDILYGLVDPRIKVNQNSKQEVA